MTAAIRAELTRLQALALARYGVAPQPEVLIDLKGKCAGKAYGTKKIRLNAEMCAKHPAEVLPTLAHEYGHIVVNTLFDRKTIKPHGREWQGVMAVLGYPAERLHTMELTAARTVTRYAYRCNCRTHRISAIKHGKIQRGAKYRCLACKSVLLRA